MNFVIVNAICKRNIIKFFFFCQGFLSNICSKTYSYTSELDFKKINFKNCCKIYYFLNKVLFYKACVWFLVNSNIQKSLIAKITFAIVFYHRFTV